MKTILTTFLLAAPIMVSAQQPFHIEGTIANLPANAEVSLVNQEGMEPAKVAEAPVTNGHFTLTGKLRGPRICTINVYVPKANSEDKMLYNKVMLMVGTDPITISADTTGFNMHATAMTVQNQVKVDGGELNRQYREYLDFTRESALRADSCSYITAKAWFDNNGNDEAIMKEREAEKKSQEAYLQTINNFIEAHPNYSVSAALVAQRFYQSFTYTQEEMQHWMDITAQNADTMHVNFMRRNHDVEMGLCLNAPYKEVEAIKKDGQTGKLSALMQPGKYTLIDFWASWCGPCRAAIPKVKAMSQDFADKLQVVSISVDEKEANWRKAEKEENMPWPLMWLNNEQMKKTGGDYSIMTIPRLVLINSEGKIVCVSHDPSIIRSNIK